MVGEAGSVENLYMDPVTDFEADLKPKLIFSKGGWKKKTQVLISRVFTFKLIFVGRIVLSSRLLV